MKNKNETKWIWITIAILLLVTIVLAAFIDIDELIKVFQHTEPVPYLISVVFLLIGILLITIRWRFLLPDKPKYGPTFHANSVSYMLKLLLPIPQVLTRLTTLSLTTSVSLYQSAPAMLVERFLETIMRLVAITLAIVLFFDFPLWIAGAATAALLLSAIPAFMVWFTRNASTAVPKLIARSAQIPDLSKEKLREAMVDFQENVSTMRAARGITVAVGYSLAMWGLFLLFYNLVFRALGQRLDTWQILAMSAAVLAVLPPSTPSMIGVYQGIIVAILLPFGFVDINTATAYAILAFGAQLAVWVVLGIVGLRRTDIKISKLSQIDLEEDEQS